MRWFALLLAFILSGCTAAVTQQANQAFELVMPEEIQVDRPLSQSGSVFLGKFATVSALNSGRAFVSDYHGELRFTVYPNEKIACRWWAEGSGINGFIEAYATLCSGRLQKNNTFEFRGAYNMKGVDGDEETFTLRGTYYGDTIIGDLIIGSVFRNDMTINEADELIDTREGVRFKAVLLE